MLLEMGALALLFIGTFYLLDKKMGFKVNKLLQATLLFLFSIVLFHVSRVPADSVQRPRNLCDDDPDRNLHVGVLDRGSLAGFPSPDHQGR